MSMNEALRTQRLDEIRKKEPYSAMEVVYNGVRERSFLFMRYLWMS